MRILVTGASGLIGSAVCERLSRDGHVVVRAVRREPEAPDEVRWDPGAGSFDVTALGVVEAAIHLAGESIGAEVRWDEAHKRRVLESRTNGTRAVAKALAGMQPRPRVLLSGSAVGFYGNRGREVLTEASGPGGGFLSELCVQWEATTAAAEDAGIRVVHLRSGLVLSRRGGLLPRMALPTRFGLGASFGLGDQYMSWITLDDEVEAILRLLNDEFVSGPVNLTAPEPVTNREMTRALGRALRRPAFLMVPRRVLRFALGEAADEMLLVSQRAVPERLTASGFVFRDPELDGALDALFARR